VGADTITALERLRVDVAFLGTNGITADHGLSTPDHDEAAAKRAMVGAARLVVCLTDSSKVGAEAAIRFATLEQVDVLVTDDGIGDDEREKFEAAGPQVVIA
ncbi:D-beta-D-heptose 1-phosphate adenosyltransferase, partial [Nocardioides hankookensis]